MKFKTVILLALVPLISAVPSRVRRQNNGAAWWETFVDGTGPPAEGTGEEPIEETKPIEVRKEVPSESTHETQPCESAPGFECVPYYLCDGGTVITDGSGVIGIRNGNLDNSCLGYLEVCCQLPNILVDHTTPPPNLNEEFCGTRNENGVHVRVSGLGPTETQFGEFPWMVAVLRSEQLGPTTGREVKLYICGGSLIAPDLVLTAAHCVNSYDAKSLVIRAGEWDTQQKYELYPHFDARVTQVFTHPNFHAANLRSDYAILQLDRGFDIAPHINPVCLPYDLHSYEGLRCYASGWGRNETDGAFQNVLKRVNLKTVNFHECQSALRTTRLGVHFQLHDSFVCAGGEKGTDTCKGDGGSPLVCSSHPTGGPYFQLGIVAWGIGCGEEGIPGVYADVSKGLEWMSQFISNNQYLCRQKKHLLGDHATC